MQLGLVSQLLVVVLDLFLELLDSCVELLTFLCELVLLAFDELFGGLKNVVGLLCFGQRVFSLVVNGLHEQQQIFLELVQSEPVFISGLGADSVEFFDELVQVCSHASLCLAHFNRAIRPSHIV